MEGLNIQLLNVYAHFCHAVIVRKITDIIISVDTQSFGSETEIFPLRQQANISHTW